MQSIDAQEKLTDNQKKLTEKLNAPGLRDRGITVVARSLGVLFVIAGGAKLLGVEMLAQMFEQWGYPVWFMFAVGTVETLAGIMMFSRPLWWLGSLAIDAIMIGALATHARANEWVMAVVPAFIFVLATIVWNEGRLAPLPPTPRRGLSADDKDRELRTMADAFGKTGIRGSTSASGRIASTGAPGKPVDSEPRQNFYAP